MNVHHAELREPSWMHPTQETPASPPKRKRAVKLNRIVYHDVGTAYPWHVGIPGRAWIESFQTQADASRFYPQALPAAFVGP
jgi:hypothetical protein